MHLAKFSELERTMQKITITTEATSSILPLIQSALARELQVLLVGVQRTRERLDWFETQYGISSGEFEQRFNLGEMGDDLEMIEWAGELKTYRLLEEQMQTLRNLQLN